MRAKGTELSLGCQKISMRWLHFPLMQYLQCRRRTARSSVSSCKAGVTPGRCGPAADWWWSASPVGPRSYWWGASQSRRTGFGCRGTSGPLRLGRRGWRCILGFYFEKNCLLLLRSLQDKQDSWLALTLSYLTCFLNGKVFRITKNTLLSWTRFYVWSVFLCTPTDDFSIPAYCPKEL